MLNLDTHVLIQALAGALRPREHALLAATSWSISAVVYWEIAKLAQLGRIVFDLDDPDLVRVLSRIHVWPVSREIAVMSTRLDIDSDPADELIAATSIVHKVPLITRDRVLLRSRQIPLAR